MDNHKEAALIMMSSGGGSGSMEKIDYTATQNGIHNAPVVQGITQVFANVYAQIPQTLNQLVLYTVLTTPDAQNDYYKTIITTDLGTDHELIIKYPKGTFNNVDNLLDMISSATVSNNYISNNTTVDNLKAQLEYINYRRIQFFIINRKSDGLPILITMNPSQYWYNYRYVSEKGKDYYVQNRCLSGSKNYEYDYDFDTFTITQKTEDALRFVLNYRAYGNTAYKYKSYSYTDEDFANDVISSSESSTDYTFNTSNPWTYDIVYYRSGAFVYDYIKEIIDDLYETHMNDKRYIRFNGTNWGGSTYREYAPTYVLGLYVNGTMVFCSHYYQNGTLLRYRDDMIVYKEAFLPTSIETDSAGRLLFSKSDSVTVKIIRAYGSYAITDLTNAFVYNLSDYWTDSFTVTESSTVTQELVLPTNIFLNTEYVMFKIFGKYEIDNMPLTISSTSPAFTDDGRGTVQSQVPVSRYFPDVGLQNIYSVGGKVVKLTMKVEYYTKCGSRETYMGGKTHPVGIYQEAVSYDTSGVSFPPAMSSTATSVTLYSIEGWNSLNGWYYKTYNMSPSFSFQNESSSGGGGAAFRVSGDFYTSITVMYNDWQEFSTSPSGQYTYIQDYSNSIHLVGKSIDKQYVPQMTSYQDIENQFNNYKSDLLSSAPYTDFDRYESYPRTRWYNSDLCDVTNEWTATWTDPAEITDIQYVCELDGYNRYICYVNTIYDDNKPTHTHTDTWTYTQTIDWGGYEARRHNLNNWSAGKLNKNFMVEYISGAIPSA